jgi:subtilisin-like proprotein convertase family protein
MTTMTRDGLLQNLGARSTRRDVLGLLRGTMVAGAVAALGAAFGARVSVEPVRAAKKKRKKKPQPTTKTGTVRETITRTFSNPTPIAIPQGAPTTLSGSAFPYPSVITIGGFTNGVIRDVNVTLLNLTHGYLHDLNILLAPAHLPGRRAFVLGDVDTTGGGGTNLTLIFDDQAAQALSEFAPFGSGTYRPTSFGNPNDFPGQGANGNSALSVFNGADPNGDWQLFVVDDADNAAGQLAGGWSLEITAEVDRQITYRPRERMRKRKGKHKKR